MTRAALDTILIGGDVAALAASGAVAFEGDPAPIQALLTNLDDFDFWFPIVTPQRADGYNRRRPLISACLTSWIALVTSMPRGQASVQLKVVRQRHTPPWSSGSPAAVPTRRHGSRR